MVHPIPRDGRAFVAFLNRRFNGRTWAVVTRRCGRVAEKYDVLLLQREYSALVAEFNATAA